MWSFWQSAVPRSPRLQDLTFPNRSRSYDATRHAVRFWGYFHSMESSFFVSTEALRRIQPDLNPDENGFLGAFDRNRDLIYATAAKVFASGSKGSYDLTVSDF